MIATKTTPAPVRKPGARLPGTPPSTRKRAKAAAAVELEPVPLGELEPGPVPDAEEETPASANAANVPPLPPTPKKKNNKVSFDVFAHYWNESVTAEQRAECVIYVYRTWPVMSPDTVERKGGLNFVNPYCMKVNAEDGPLTEALVRARVGFGDFYLRLNQNIVSPHKTVLMADLNIARNWDKFEEWPILDTEKIDLADPQNQEYVKRLKLRGILKAAGEQSSEENDMNNSHSEALGRSVEKLTETVVDMANKSTAAAQTATAGQAARVSEGEAAVSVSLVNLLKETMHATTPADKQGGTIEHLTGLANLAKSIAPVAADQTPLINALKETQATILQMQVAATARAEAEAVAAREEAKALRAAMPAPKTLLEQLNELEQLDKLRGKISGRRHTAADDDEEREEKPAGVAGFLGAAAPMLESVKTIFVMGAGMYANYCLMKTGRAVDPATHQQTTAPIVPDPTATMSPEERANMEEMQALFDQLQRIEPFLLNFVEQNKTGGEFAKFVLDASNLRTLESIQNAGAEKILTVIQQYPPIWDVVKGSLPRFETFIADFVAWRIAPPGSHANGAATSTATH